MNTEKRPDESLLTAYLYGELDEQQRAEAEQYLAENPEARQELATLQAIRTRLAALSDKEVIVPQSVYENIRAKKTFPRFAVNLLAIAASVTLILISGWVAGIELKWHGNELHITFGRERVSENPQQLTRDDVQLMINETLARHTVAATDAPADLEKQVQNWVKASLPAQTAKENQPNLDEYLRQYTAALYTENARIMREYINLASAEQRQAIEELLLDYTRYLNEQRQSDLEKLYTRLYTIEQNTELYKQETNQLLTGIITTVGASPVKETRY
ncbi:MAG: hypothetical protein KatS3mg032_1900 [Cyclobacteriaceae bacterium]|nr:MAG: hypothetical protein KatS3mg032_1900 [Cyclobacteriaceae bacterium]